MALPADILDEVRRAARAAIAKKAFHIVGLEVAGLTSIADSFLLCSGASARQVDAIVDAVEAELKGAGRRPLHVEGDPRSGWMLLDYGDFIVHVFTEEKRSYYALDSLWGDAPRLEVGEPGSSERGLRS